MKLLFIFSLTWVISLVALAVDPIILDHYCGCRGQLGLGGDQRISFNDKTTEFISCKNQIQQILPSNAEDGDGNTEELIESKIRKDENDKSNFLCNKTDIKDFLAKYQKLQKLSEDGLESRVEQEICGANDVNKGSKSKVKQCRESLLDLLAEHEKTLYQSCKEDFKNRDKKKQISKCVQIASYELLLNTNDAKFYEDVCPKDNLKGCVDDIRSKLANTYFQKEVQQCNEKNGFTTDKSVVVCKDVLLSKILAYSTQAEKNKLFSCINSQSPTNTKGIEACVSAFYAFDNKSPDEKKLLEQLSNKYCKTDSYQTDESQKKCLKDLLIENSQDYPLENQCTSIQEPLEQKKCQRLKLYENLINDKESGFFECWDRNKFSNIDDRNKCDDLSKDANKEVEKCNKFQDQQYVNCLSKISTNKLNGFNVGQQEAIIALEKFLKNKFIDYRSCQNVQDKFTCLQNLYTQSTQPQSSSIATNTTSSIPFSSDIEGNSGNKNIMGNLAMGGSVLGAGLTIANTNGSNGKGKQDNPSKEQNKAGCKFENSKGVGIDEISKCQNGNEQGLVAGGGQAKTPQNNPAIQNAEQLTKGKNGFWGLYKDLNYLKVRPLEGDSRSVGPCNALKKAALVRITGKVLATATTIYAGYKAKEAYEKKKEQNKAGGADQDSSFSWQLDLLAGVGAGLGINLATNFTAESILSPQITTAASATSEGDPINCSMKGKKGAPKTSFNSFVYKHSKSLHAKVNQEIQSSKNMAELETVTGEIDRFIDGELSSITIDEYQRRLSSIDQLMVKDEEFSYIKKAFTLTSKVAPFILFDDAFAASSENPGFLQQMTKQLLPMFLMGTVMNALSRPIGQGEGLSNLSYSKKDDSQPEAKTEHKQEAEKITGDANKKIEQEVPKFDVLTLLVDYKQVIGPEKETYLDELKKNAMNIGTVKKLKEQVQIPTSSGQ